MSSKKSITMTKNIERGPFGVIKFFFEKSFTMPKKRKRGPFRLAQYCMIR